MVIINSLARAPIYENEKPLLRRSSAGSLAIRGLVRTPEEVDFSFRVT